MDGTKYNYLIHLQVRRLMSQWVLNPHREWIDGPGMSHGSQTLSDKLALGAGQRPGWITYAVGPGATIDGGQQRTHQTHKTLPPRYPVNALCNQGVPPSRISAITS
ncbi:hypothetical protein GCM10027066_33340 [Dyella jejuensis]